MKIVLNGNPIDVYNPKEGDSDYANTLRNVLAALVNLRIQSTKLPDNRIWKWWKTLIPNHMELIASYLMEERK